MGRWNCLNVFEFLVIAWVVTPLFLFVCLLDPVYLDPVVYCFVVRMRCGLLLRWFVPVSLFCCICCLCFI